MYYEQQEADVPYFVSKSMRKSKNLRECYFCGNYIMPGELYERTFWVDSKEGEKYTQIGHVNGSCLSGG